jgi:hypothetical protein
MRAWLTARTTLASATCFVVGGVYFLPLLRTISLSRRKSAEVYGVVVQHTFKPSKLLRRLDGARDGPALRELGLSSRITIDCAAILLHARTVDAGPGEVDVHNGRLVDEGERAQPLRSDVHVATEGQRCCRDEEHGLVIRACAPVQDRER